MYIDAKCKIEKYKNILLKIGLYIYIPQNIFLKVKTYCKKIFLVIKEWLKNLHVTFHKLENYATPLICTLY